MANLSQLWFDEPKSSVTVSNAPSMTGVNLDLQNRLDQAKSAWFAQTGKELPITSGSRDYAKQKNLVERARSGEKGIFMPANPDVNKKDLYHTDAVDISQSVPDSFLNQFGLHRPLGLKDPVHVTINPKVDFKTAPKEDSLASLWDTTEPSKEFGKKPTITGEVAKAGMKNVGEFAKTSSEFGKGVTSLADTALGVVPAVVGGVTYAGARAFQQSPEEAQALASKVSEPLTNPIGKAFGITQDPAYQNEASRRAMEAVGKYIGESAQTISQKTGIPVQDVENMINTLTIPAGKGISKVGGVIAEQVKAPMAPLVDAQPVAKPRLSYQEAQQQFNAKRGPTQNIPPEVPQEVAMQIKQAIGDDELTPVVAQQVKDAVARGEKINPKELEAHNTAQSLLEPIELTPGQKSGDPVLISKERNERGFKEAFAQKFNEQNKALMENAVGYKREFAPNVKTTDYVHDAQTIIDEIKAISKEKEDLTKADYKALQDAGGGKFPVDGKLFADNAIAKLIEEDRLDYLPKEIKVKLENYANGKKEMNLNLFENLRTDLATDMRKADRAGDGTQKHVLSVVRDQLEQLPMSTENAQIKTLADKARSSAKADFDLEKTNELYKKVLNESADSKDFIKNFVFQSKNADFVNSLDLLQSKPAAMENLRSGAMDYIIRESTDASGNFKNAKFNDLVESLDINKKLEPLFGEQGANKLRKLVATSQRIEARPKGAFVNESNTTTAGAAMIKEYGPSIIKEIPYIGGPITAISELGGKMKAYKETKEALKPGAGISTKKSKGNDLKDIGK